MRTMPSYEEEMALARIGDERYSRMKDSALIMEVVLSTILREYKESKTISEGSINSIEIIFKRIKGD